MICLGIDPGLGLMGYGLVRQEGDALRALDYGVISTESKEPIPTRLRALYAALRTKIAEYRPDAVAVERLYFGRNITTAEMVYEARGVILLAAAEFGFVPYEPKPSEVKMAVCGYGAAEKAQVQGMVRCLLNLKEIPRPDDAADALAIAVTGLSLAMHGRGMAEGCR